MRRSTGRLSQPNEAEYVCLHSYDYYCVAFVFISSHYENQLVFIRRR